METIVIHGRMPVTAIATEDQTGEEEGIFVPVHRQMPLAACLPLEQILHTIMKKNAIARIETKLTARIVVWHTMTD